MIQIGNGQQLCELMEHRYEPILCQVLRSVSSRGPMTLLAVNPGKTCLPVREIWLSVEPYTPGQVGAMCSTINTYWQYDEARTQPVIDYEKDCNGERIIIRVCDETRRM